ncbi:MAG: helix-turn-helix transcriptional regulator [Proteobacteria bacterium]|nr:helix-turn-helix transcriptional regulator [Pseudomonadota bacterium]
MQERQHVTAKRPSPPHSTTGDAVSRAIELAVASRGAKAEGLIPALVAVLKRAAPRAEEVDAALTATLEPQLIAAAQSDREGIVAVLSGLIAVRLIDRRSSDAGQQKGKRLSPELLFGITEKLASDLVGDNAYLQQLAQWLVAGAQAWSVELGRLDEQHLAEQVLRLVAVYGAESVGTVVNLLESPAPIDDDLETLIGRSRRSEAAPPATGAAEDMLVVLSSAHFQSLREALYKNNFRRVAGSPWPTAPLERDGAKSYAQLRPAAMDLEPLLAPRAIEAWATTMWRQQSELSDLDADALDALCAIYLSQARGPNDTAIADVDEILAMRGLKPKRGGTGRRGGYEAEQRADMLRALSHIQNVWINVAEVMVYERENRSRQTRGPVTKTLQSRPFIITDRMGQIRLDGYLEVERFIFRPGKAFAAFLFGSGQETGVLFKKALQYDPFRRKWEKRLTRYMSWHWRGASLSGEFTPTYRVQTLLAVVGEPLNERYPSKTRARLEQALDQLANDRVLLRWSYKDWNAGAAAARGWIAAWLDAEVTIEMPPSIRDYYARVRDHDGLHAVEPRPTNDAADLASRFKRLRKALGLSQQQAAVRLGIQQGHVSKIERGKAAPSPQLRRAIEAWLMEVA